ncbi:MAG: isopentenyl phosphate kinase [Candidatus Bilamarchaeaceae archaeon]
MKIAVKLGGSIITDKGRFRTPNMAVIRSSAKAIASAYKKGNRFVVVHGAGSYGHMPANKYGLSEGAKGKEGLHNYAEVHMLCEEISLLIVQELLKNGVPAVAFHPATFVLQHRKQPKKFHSHMLLKHLEEGFVPVTHGDVVLDTGQRTSIISGDGLMEYFGKFFADTLIYASDVDGLLVDGKPVKLVTKKNFRSVYAKVGGSGHTDVTGGMRNKIRNLMKLRCTSYIVNGRKPGRLKALLEGKNASVCTKFVPK